jgi:hypothetical protein
VLAKAEGCWAPGNPSQSYVETDPFNVPPEKVGIILQLECPEPGQTSPQPTTVERLRFADWSTGSKYGKGGYCDYVNIRNNTSQDISGWSGDITITDGDVYSPFNVTVSNNTVHFESVPWNARIPAGKTLIETYGPFMGFCVERYPVFEVN